MPNGASWPRGPVPNQRETPLAVYSDKTEIKKPVGLKEIASELGLDVSTVSRALNNDPRVKPETSARILETAKRLDYRPNMIARSLRGGRTNRVAVLLSPTQNRFANPIFLELLATLDQRLRKTSKLLTVIAAQQRDEELELVRSIVEDRIADAILLGRTRTDDPRVSYLLERGFPFVTMGRTPWPDRHPWVEIDYERAGAMAVEELVRSGPERLVIVTGPKGLLFAEYYLAGARKAAEANGLTVERVIHAEITEDAGEAVGHEILKLGPRLAIAAIQDSLAFGIYRAAAARSVAIGKTVSIFGGQNFPGGEHASPSLSTFTTSDTRVAELLSTVLIDRLEQPPDAAFDTWMITPEPLLRQSHRLPD